MSTLERFNFFFVTMSCFAPIKSEYIDSSLLLLLLFCLTCPASPPLRFLIPRESDASATTDAAASSNVVTSSAVDSAAVATAPADNAGESTILKSADSTEKGNWKKRKRRSQYQPNKKKQSEAGLWCWAVDATHQF